MSDNTDNSLPEKFQLLQSQLGDYAKIDTSEGYAVTKPILLDEERGRAGSDIEADKIGIIVVKGTAGDYGMVMNTNEGAANNIEFPGGSSLFGLKLGQDPKEIVDGAATIMDGFQSNLFEKKTVVTGDLYKEMMDGNSTPFWENMSRAKDKPREN